MVQYLKKKLARNFTIGGLHLRRPQNCQKWCFEAYVIPSPLVVKFLANFFFKFWIILMKYVECPGPGNIARMIFKPKLIFVICSLNTAYT